MGNEPEEKIPQNLQLAKSLTLNYERSLTKKDNSEKDKKEFIKFRNHMLKFEYYKNILKLGCKKNPVLKLLYRPESSFNDYNLQMFYILENIPYVNYEECLHLLDIKHSHTYQTKKIIEDFSPINVNKITDDSPNNNESSKKSKNEVTLLKKSSFRTSDKGNVRKTATFDLTKIKHFNMESNNITQEENKVTIRTFKEGLSELIEKICLFDEKKIQKILLIYPINNMRWFIWLGMAKVKYRQINEKINISNKEIYDDLVKKINYDDDSLMFELHNTLKEIKVYKYNWSNSFYRIIKCLTSFEQNMKYETGMNILIGVPLLISDCNEEETFFFGRYLLSVSYGLGLYFFYDENEILLNYIVYIFHVLAKEKYPKIYERLIEFNVADDLWIKKWIKSFFSSIFDLSITIRVWDCVIGVGIKFLVNYSLAILEYFKDNIMSFKKVKEFLEFFDYELRKKFKKDKEIISFRESILTLAQSFYIPDGKYQLIEKDYLNVLFPEKDNSSSKSNHFDTSKTINNYYSNNDSLNDDQYHVKLILRTLIYIPHEFIINNVEEQNILTYVNKKSKNMKRKSKTMAQNFFFTDNQRENRKNKLESNLNELLGIRSDSIKGDSQKQKESSKQNSLIKSLTKDLEEKKLVNDEKIILENEDEIKNKNKEEDLIANSENNKTNEIDIMKSGKDLVNNDKIKDNQNKDKYNNSDEEDNDVSLDFNFYDEQNPTI